MGPNPLIPSEHYFTEKWETTPDISIDIQDHKFYFDLSKVEFMQVVWKGTTPDHWKIFFTGRPEGLTIGLGTGQRIWEALKRLKAEIT